MTPLGPTPLKLLGELRRTVAALRRREFRLLEFIRAFDRQGAAKAFGYKDFEELFTRTLYWDLPTIRPLAPPPAIARAPAG